MTHTRTKTFIKNTTLLIVALFVSTWAIAQGPLTWNFGQKAAIFFNSGITVSFVGGSNMSTPEGCANYEDGAAAPTFYTNGSKIWNASGTIIKNGNDIDGSINSCQSSLFYHTTHSDTVYLFTTDDHTGNKGLRYNLFKRVNGKMKLQTKNNILLPSSTERMTLANHCNEKSMWLITHQWNSNAFYTYKINEDSLELTPIISNTGSVHNGNTLNAKGCIKASWDGTKVALAKMSNGTVEVFHFDNITGTIYDPILLTGVPNAYGVEFSKSGNVLYVSSVSGQIYQFDLTSWNASSIQNTKFTLFSQAQLLGSLQMGPDNMIYVAQDNSFYLGRIELPNSMGTSCLYNPTAIYLNGKKCEAGLPQIYNRKTGFDFKVPIECIGDTSFFKIMGDTTRLDSVKWYFGDNPILDSSQLFSPFYIFKALGNYKVKLLIYHCDTVDTLISFAGVVGPPIANLGPDTSFCSNDTKVLDGGRSSFYLWDDGSIDTIRTVNAPGIYWLRLKNSCGEDYDTIEVLGIYQAPTVILRADTTICNGDSLILDAGNDSMLSIWQGYDTSRYYIAKYPTYYKLEKVDSNGCRASEGFTLSVDDPPYINLGPDTTICIGYDLLFNGSSQGFYHWQDGSSDTNYRVTTPGIYYVSISNACGIVHDSCEVSYEDCRQIIWVPNAFTPNNDGVNDYFKPYLENVLQYHLYIYNRWGELVFETQDLNRGWNGYYKGKAAETDSYTWRIDYVNFDGEHYNQYGFVILYR